VVAVVSPLPTWASTSAARALLDAIMANPPESYSRRASIMGPADEKFSASGDNGKLFYRLRRIYRDWFERQLHALDAQFAVVGVWDEEVAKDLHRTEDAEALVRRLLSEAEKPEARAA
jgi:hypothetical protein